MHWAFGAAPIQKSWISPVYAILLKFSNYWPKLTHANVKLYNINNAH